MTLIFSNLTGGPETCARGNTETETAPGTCASGNTEPRSEARLLENTARGGAQVATLSPPGPANGNRNQISSRYRGVFDPHFQFVPWGACASGNTAAPRAFIGTRFANLGFAWRPLALLRKREGDVEDDRAKPYATDLEPQGRSSQPSAPSARAQVATLLPPGSEGGSNGCWVRVRLSVTPAARKKLKHAKRPAATRAAKTGKTAGFVWGAVTTASVSDNRAVGFRTSSGGGCRTGKRGEPKHHPRATY